MNILILIIHNDDPLYNQMIEVQRKYIHSYSNITSYIVQMNPDIEEEIKLENDVLFVKGQETYHNILWKTICALEYAIPKKKYDYVIRTNASTILDFEKVNEYFLSANKHELYTGGRILELEWTDPSFGIVDETYFHTPFAQGSLIVCSIDIIEKMLSEKEKIKFSIIDDVSIAIFIKENTNINTEKIYNTKPSFCLDNVSNCKLKDYTNERCYFAYRNHRSISYSWGNREADLEEMKNQVNCLYFSA